MKRCWDICTVTVGDPAAHPVDHLGRCLHQHVFLLLLLLLFVIICIFFFRFFIQKIKHTKECTFLLSFSLSINQ